MDFDGKFIVMDNIFRLEFEEWTIFASKFKNVYKTKFQKSYEN